MPEKSPFFVLPDGCASAPENMAADTALLEAFPRPDSPRFRHYAWEGDAWTFGYAQRFDDVRAQLPRDALPVRRPTGGGVVDHRDDWTYALAIPFGHALCRMKAPDSYVAVHAALAEALKKCGAPARLALCAESAKGPLPACFMAPSPGDVVTPNGRKLAGAAQKRNRHGLLVQGSIAKAGISLDWENFKAAFIETLAGALNAVSMHWEQPFIPPQILRERYLSSEWNRRR